MSPEITRPDEAAEVRKSVRTYLLVGLLLFCGTVATVAIATVPWLDVGAHGFDGWDALLGIAIAATKAALVAAVFMHLSHERRLVYGIGGLAGIIVTGCFVGTYWHFADLTNDPHFYRGVERPADLSAGVQHPGQGKNNPPLETLQDPAETDPNSTPEQIHEEDRNP